MIFSKHSFFDLPVQNLKVVIIFNKKKCDNYSTFSYIVLSNVKLKKNTKQPLKVAFIVMARKCYVLNAVFAVVFTPNKLMKCHKQ